MVKTAIIATLLLSSAALGTVIFDSSPVFSLPYSPYDVQPLAVNMNPHVLRDNSDTLRVVGWSFTPGDIFYQDKLFLKLTDNNTGESIYIEHDNFNLGQTYIFDYSSGGFEFDRSHSYTWSYFVTPEPSMLWAALMMIICCRVRR